MIDLHIHSTFSDGSFTPAELVEKARGIGLTAMALTDHDCTNGIDQFLEACRKGGMPQELPMGIPGVEISADVKRGTMHILGYYIDHKVSSLQENLRQIREGREIRNWAILANLNSIGIKLEFEEVAAYAGEDVVGRPHFAQAMLAKGYVSSTEDAFERYLKKGRPGYADRFRFSPEDSIEAILKADGVPVLSHPLTLELDNSELAHYMKRLKDSGLQGVEVYYSEHSPAQVQKYLTLAKELDLIITGGSDFHGAINPAVNLGSGFGSLHVPDHLAQDLKRRSEELAEKRRILS